MSFFIEKVRALMVIERGTKLHIGLFYELSSGAVFPNVFSVDLIL